MVLPLQPRDICMYTGAIYSHRSGLQQPYSITCSGEPPKPCLQNTFLLQHSFALFLPKAYQQFNPTSCRLGQCSSFHISTISTCFISLAQDLMLQPHEFCLRLLTLRYHYEETICCSPFFLSSKYKNKNNWLRTWAQGEQIPFCSLPPLLAVLNSHCLQTPLRKTNFNSYTK